MTIPQLPDVLDSISERQFQRHSWLFRAGEQIRRWKAEDAAAGMPWGETFSKRDAVSAQEAAADYHGN